jgi:hypothetical protein
MLSLALWAGAIDRRMSTHVRQFTATVRQALRLAMLGLLEGLELQAQEEARTAEETAAENYEAAKHTYRDKAEREHAYASRERHRGDYLERLSQMEASEAAHHAAAAQRDEAERLALLANITALEADENTALTELREIHEGACKWAVVNKICETVGGASALQERADADYVEIHNDWRKATLLGRQEVVQNTAADVLKGKAGRFNQTAGDLFRVANAWDARAQQDFENEVKVNATAAKLEEDVERLKAEESEGLEVEVRVDELVEKLMSQAEQERVAAYRCAVAAILTAVTALLFFCGKIIPRARQKLEAMLVNGDYDWPTKFYVAAHAMILLSVVGLAGDYFVYMDMYTSVQRGVIIVWFAVIASWIQTICLHALPWAIQQVLAEDPSELDIFAFGVEMSTRYLVFVAMFLLEVLLLWLTLGHWLFDGGVVKVLSSAAFRFAVVLAVVAYGILVEAPRRQASSSSSDSVSTWPENRTIQFSGDSPSAISANSEVTPLCKADFTSWGTTIDIGMGVGRGSDSTSRSTAGALSATNLSVFGALWEDLRKLLLPFEILLVACLIAVLRNALHVVRISHPTWAQCGVLVCALGVLVAALWFTREARGEKTWSSTTTRKLFTDTNKSRFEMVQRV